MVRFIVQSSVIVSLAYFVVVYPHVYGFSERIYRDDYDTFDNPSCRGSSGCGRNCTDMNAQCTDVDEHSPCSKCTCFGLYKTYLPSVQRCVRDNRLLFFPAKTNLFLIESTDDYQTKGFCMTYNHITSYNITLTACNSSDTAQQWIRTQYNQLLHVETSKCVQSGESYKRSTIWYLTLGLEECDISETKQKWKCAFASLQQPFSGPSHMHTVNMEYGTNLILIASTGQPKYWRRYESRSTGTACSSLSVASGCDEFDNPGAPILVLHHWKGEHQIASHPGHTSTAAEDCHILRNQLNVLSSNNWSRWQFVEKIFSLSKKASGTFLKWNLTNVPSNWTNLLIKLNFNCTHSKQKDSSVLTNVTRCVIIKLKDFKEAYSDSTTQVSSTAWTTTRATEYYTKLAPLTRSTKRFLTIWSQHSSSTVQVPASLSKTTNAVSTVNITPTSTIAINSGSKTQHEPESTNLVAIIIGSLIAVLVLCAVILVFVFYRRKTRRRLGKTSSTVPIHSTGQSLNPIYHTADRDICDGMYEEPGESMGASRQCNLYEKADTHEYEYLEVEMNNKSVPLSQESEYDYAKSDDIRSAVQRLSVGDNDCHSPTMSKNNDLTTVNDNKKGHDETENETGPVYQTLECE